MFVTRRKLSQVQEEANNWKRLANMRSEQWARAIAEREEALVTVNKLRQALHAIERTANKEPTTDTVSKVGSFARAALAGKFGKRK